jgi:hypothetical protein
MRGSNSVKTLGEMVEGGAGAAQIAEASVAIWTAIDAALAPVIGPRGSAALFKRSLHLTRASHPLLAEAYHAASTPGDYSGLRTVLSRQAPTDAAAAHDAMLRTFNDLLADLIGRSLTQRLLQAAWEPPSSAAGEQDAPP